MRRRVGFGLFLGAGLLVAGLLAFAVSPWASGEPDGLERVAEDEGFADAAEDHVLADGPTADYSVSGLDDEGLSTGVAGLLGVAVVFGATAGLFLLVRRPGGGGSDGRDDAVPVRPDARA